MFDKGETMRWENTKESDRMWTNATDCFEDLVSDIRT